jgi:citrate synthase
MSSQDYREKQAQKEIKDTLTIIDNRTGKSVEIPIKHNTISASDLKKIKSPDGVPLMYAVSPSSFNPVRD